jgi:ABC-type nitrate/sulfonate/bicarbonate transport system substrate-binding protein
MKGLTGLRKMALAGLALVAGMCTVASAQEKIVDLKTCWQPEHSTYIYWNAKEKGWTKEAGINPEFVYFDSGMAQMEALPAKQWVVGGTGSVPMLVGAMRYGAYLIGIANDDSTSNAVMVRPDSPILKSKGAVTGFPETFGTAEEVRGKTVLVTTVSSGHYALSTWLKRLGLKDKDVVIKNMDQGQMLAAFESGIGDIAVLWAPSMFTGISKGWKVVNRDSQKGSNMVNVLVADKKFADENPEVVARFLKSYMKGIDAMKTENVKLAGGFVKFLNDWAGVKISEQDATMDIKEHTVYTLDEQLKMFDASKGSSDVEKWMAGMADFFVEQGKFKKEEMDKTMKSGFVTDKFLKLAAQMK